MKIAISLILSLSIFTNTFAQSIDKLSSADSIKLTHTWKEFKTALENKDLKSLKKISLKIVQCDLFQTPDPNKDISPYISIDTFTKQFFHDTKLWHVVETKKYHLRADPQTTFHPEFSKTKKGKGIRYFEVWFVVWEPNELAKGHEGGSDAFQFVKIGDNFKFYGMTSIP